MQSVPSLVLPWGALPSLPTPPSQDGEAIVSLIHWAGAELKSVSVSLLPLTYKEPGHSSLPCGLALHCGARPVTLGSGAPFRMSVFQMAAPRRWEMKRLNLPVVAEVGRVLGKPGP